MTFSERRRAAAALRAVLDALLASGIDPASPAAPDLRQRCGALSVGAQDQIEAGTFGSALRACFAAATAAGATFAGMDRARQVAEGAAEDDLGVRRVTETAARLALVEMCRILAAGSYASRQEIDAAITRLNTAFAPAEDFAASRFSDAVWRALTALHATAVRDLGARARPLPRMVPYAFQGRMPLLALSNRLYGDAGRSGELLAENVGVVHPLFMPGNGQALGN